VLALFDWTPQKLYTNHNQWTAEARYQQVVNAKQYLGGEMGSPVNLRCEMDKYAEVKALIAGTTSFLLAPVGVDSCYSSVVRTIDTAENGLGVDKIQTSISVPSSSTAAQTLCTKFQSGATNAYVVRVAEGTDATALAEFATLYGRAGGCLLAPQTTIDAARALGVDALIGSSRRAPTSSTGASRRSPTRSPPRWPATTARSWPAPRRCRRWRRCGAARESVVAAGEPLPFLAEPAHGEHRVERTLSARPDHANGHRRSGQRDPGRQLQARHERRHDQEDHRRRRDPCPRPQAEVVGRQAPQKERRDQHESIMTDEARDANRDLRLARAVDLMAR
jgi:hypothetical protein